MQTGYKLLESNNQWQEITSVTVKAEPLKAYNLTVDQTHTYFIKGVEAGDGVWVHNSCPHSLLLISDSEELRYKVISLYGGAGSFNDFILHKFGKPLIEENDELDSLRHHLYQVCQFG